MKRMTRTFASICLLCLAAWQANAQTDLSAEGTANCYIVTGEGVYSFRAAVGNSGKPVAGMASADWLWQTDRKLVSEVSYSGGTVTFRAGSMKGNAVIAALDEGGNILWSWHIWATDDPRTDTHFAFEERISFMDRNLGATSTAVDDVASYGLYYQWGRKDPFIGAEFAGSFDLSRRYEDTGFTEGTALAFFNPAIRGTDWFTVVPNNSDRIETGKCVEYAIAHPTAFIGFSAESFESGKGSWFNDRYGRFDRLWGFISSRRPVNKTIYDPCPPGWKVPANSSEAWFGFETAEPAGRLAGQVYYFKARPYYYPAAGTRRQTNGKLQYAGASGIYWSATPNGVNAMSLRLEEEEIRINLRAPRATGASVRCVRE